MPKANDNPLLLLDNGNMMSVVNEGEFKCSNLSFHEAKAIIEMYDEKDIIKCFTNNGIEDIIFNYLGIARKEYEYKHVRNMRPGQDAIAFKLYETPSETQPVIEAGDGVEAKNIKNVYVYCQYIARIK